MANRIFKIIGSLSIALVVALGSFFVPNIKTTCSESSHASVIPPPSENDSSYTDSYYFLGSDIFYVNMMRMGVPIFESPWNTDFTFSDYIDFGVYDNISRQFKISFGLGYQTLFNGRSRLNMLVKAQRSVSNLEYISSSGSPNDAEEFDSYQSLGLVFDTESDGSIYLDTIQSSFVPGEIYNLFAQSYFGFVRSNGSNVGAINFGFQIYKDNRNIDSFVAPTFNMQYLLLLNYTEVESVLGIPYSDVYSPSNVICYVDTAGYYYLFYVNSGNYYNPDGSVYFFNYRRYILSTDSITDNQYYQQGLSDGYQNGYDSGSLDGYQNGYGAGLLIGKSEGYSDGINAGSRLTFSNLMTSVIDVPVKVFINLFDFDVLGVNILVFLSTLLTISLVIFLIKKIKGA